MCRGLVHPALSRGLSGLPSWRCACLQQETFVPCVLHCPAALLHLLSSLFSMQHAVCQLLQNQTLKCTRLGSSSVSRHGCVKRTHSQAVKPGFFTSTLHKALWALCLSVTDQMPSLGCMTWVSNACRLETVQHLRRWPNGLEGMTQRTQKGQQCRALLPWRRCQVSKSNCFWLPCMLHYDWDDQYGISCQHEAALTTA